MLVDRISILDFGAVSLHLMRIEDIIGVEPIAVDMASVDRAADVQLIAFHLSIGVEGLDRGWCNAALTAKLDSIGLELVDVNAFAVDHVSFDLARVQFSCHVVVVLMDFAVAVIVDDGT